MLCFNVKTEKNGSETKTLLRSSNDLFAIRVKSETLTNVAETFAGGGGNDLFMNMERLPQNQHKEGGFFMFGKLLVTPKTANVVEVHHSSKYKVTAMGPGNRFSQYS